MRSGSAKVAFGTAWHMLFNRAKVQVGETVLINSVGSGIGSAAVQLAKLGGAFVIGNSSRKDKLAKAKEFGLDVAINYTKQACRDRHGDQREQGRRRRLRARRRRALPEGLDCLKFSGRLVTVAHMPSEVVDFDIIPFFRSQKRVIGSFVYTRDEFEKVLELADRGKITPLVDSTFPLAAGEGGDGAAWRAGTSSGRSSSRREGARDEAGRGRCRRNVHRPDLRRRRGGHDPRPQAPHDARGPVAGNDRRGSANCAGKPASRRRARPGLPRHDDRDEHRHRAQRRDGRDDHDRGLPRHPPHRAAQEAAQLLELPGPAVAALPARPAALPADRPRAHHAATAPCSSRSTRRGA